MIPVLRTHRPGRIAHLGFNNLPIVRMEGVHAWPGHRKRDQEVKVCAGTANRTIAAAARECVPLIQETAKIIAARK